MKIAKPTNWLVLSSVAFLALTVTNPLSAEPTAQWSSFQNGGRTLGETKLPTKWSKSDGIAWQKKLEGYGQSTPVVHGDRIFVTFVSGDMKDKCHIQALSSANGESLWKYDLDNSSPEKNTSYVSRAAPSPVCDDDGVIAFFEGGNILAVDHDGELRWKRDLVADLGPVKARHGLASSLEQNESAVFVWVEREADPYVLALSKKTGETIWKAPGVGGTAWSSPRLIPVGDGNHLVLSGNSQLVGLDPQSGDQLWKFDEISGNTTPTPMPLGNGRFLIGATTGRNAGDGANAAKSNGVIEVQLTDDGKFKVDYVWRAKRATSSFGSPIAYRGHAYFVNRSGVVYCLDLENGEEKYSKRTASSVWATPIGADDKVFLFGKDGNTSIIQAGGEFKLVGKNGLWESSPQAAEGGRPSFGGPVLYAGIAVDHGFLLRRGDQLFMVR